MSPKRTRAKQTMNDDPWKDLPPAGDAGRVTGKRVHESGRWNFYWGRDHEGRCLLTLRHGAGDHEGERLPRLNGVQVSRTAPGPAAPPTLIITLLDKALRDLFLLFCRDIVSAAEAMPSENQAVHAALRRTWSWHHLLRGGGGARLSLEEQRGLFGEVAFLGAFVLERMSVRESLEAWKGPTGAPQDFVVQHAAVECKTLGREGNGVVRISSLRQLLAEEGRSLFLHALSLWESQDGEEGTSLDELIAATRARIVADAPGEAGHFDALLAAAGWRRETGYETPKWCSRAYGTYRIGTGFPGLTRNTVPDAVLEAKYLLNLAVCNDFASSEDSVREALGGANYGC